MATSEKIAGLVDANGNCINAIIVTVDENGAVVDYTPGDGLALILTDGAGVGKKWDGQAFHD